MELTCLKEDRKELVKALEKRLETKAKYLGAPSMAYEIGKYKITKDWMLTFDEHDADLELLDELAAKQFIEPREHDAGSTIISLPLEVHDGGSLTNLVFRINSKDELLSKACGKKGAFKISRDFIAELDREKPRTTEQFMAILERLGGSKINTGIAFTEDKIVMTGFPYTSNSEIVDAYMRLTEKMSNEAVLKKRIRPDRVGLTDNERYTFRNWLVSIGMVGEEYKSARAILLRNLSGHSAFRTPAQADAAKIKIAEVRRERKEKECSKFQVI